jgi:hypothetical protein
MPQASEALSAQEVALRMKVMKFYIKQRRNLFLVTSWG